MGDDLGATQTTSAFMWQMPVLFQESIRGLIGSTPDLRLVDHRPGTARIYDAAGKRRVSSKVDPDLVLRTSSGTTLLLDTKYKDALPHGVTTRPTTGKTSPRLANATESRWGAQTSTRWSPTGSTKSGPAPSRDCSTRSCWT